MRLHKVSPMEFGSGGGKTIDKIVKEDILEGLLETNRDIDVRETRNTFSLYHHTGHLLQ